MLPASRRRRASAPRTPAARNASQLRQRDGSACGVGHDRVDVGAAARHRHAAALEQQQQALDAHAEADRRRGLAAELLEQAVVAAAAADRALRAELVGDPLEHREVVVVHAAHQARIDAVVEAGGVEQPRARRRSARATRSPRKSISLRRGLDRSPASPGSCVSRMRSGLVCSRRCASSSSASACCLEVRDQRGAVRARARRAGRGCSARAARARRRRPSSLPQRARTSRSCSASTSGPAKPSASTSSWWNWR